MFQKGRALYLELNFCLKHLAEFLNLLYNFHLFLPTWNVSVKQYFGVFSWKYHFLLVPQDISVTTLYFGWFQEAYTLF